MIPNRLLDEMRLRSDDEIDVLKAFMKAFENDYIQLFPGHANTQIVNGVVKKELTRSLGACSVNANSCRSLSPWPFR